jgi:general secretion pathway protein E
MANVETNSPAELNLEAVQVPAEFLDRIPLRFAREHAVIAVAKEGDGDETRYRLASGYPDRHWVTDRIAYKLDSEVEVVPAESKDVLALISRAYHAEAKEVKTIAEELAAEAPAGGEISLTEDVLELDDKAPAVKLVHAMLLQAVKQRASDIHIEPSESALRVRFRIDGVLYERAALRPEAREGVASRVKVMGRMDIAERRLPQDGGVTIRIGERRIDLRISTLPSVYGERVVMRLLDKHTGLLSVEGLGLSADDLDKTKRLLALSHGVILVTGPTGCGKTTTLYAMLSGMNSPELNILTLEDPVEYQLPGICQTQVSEKKGLTFAKGLRALVRQDPDIIMVGEIRDLETASVAIQSSLTGHLVLSTLHTNDAPSSVTRLLDLGVEPFLVASSVNAAIAQRLVRRVCPACAEQVPVDREEAKLAGWLEPELEFLRQQKCATVPKSRGCEACFNTGFIGRIGIYEYLFMSDTIRELISRRAPASEIKKAAIERGMITLRRDGLRKVAAGITTLDEVRAATQMDLE